MMLPEDELHAVLKAGRRFASRDRKLRKRHRLAMTEDGRSVKLLLMIINKKAQHDLEGLHTQVPVVRTRRKSK